jgi:hypothetical protein
MSPEPWCLQVFAVADDRRQARTIFGIDDPTDPLSRPPRFAHLRGRMDHPSASLH